MNTPAAQHLAKEAADQSIVLMKNEKHTLPLKATGGAEHKTMTVPVLGRNANATSNMQGNYFGTAPYLISPVQGIKHYATTSYNDGVDTEAAIKLLAGADAVVLVVGLLSDCSLNGKRAPGSACALGKSDEAEGHDRTSLILPSNQDALITDVAAAASKKDIPVVLVVMSGGTLAQPIHLLKKKPKNTRLTLIQPIHPLPPEKQSDSLSHSLVVLSLGERTHLCGSYSQGPSTSVSIRLTHMLAPSFGADILGKLGARQSLMSSLELPIPAGA